MNRSVYLAGRIGFRYSQNSSLITGLHQIYRSQPYKKTRPIHSATSLGEHSVDINKTDTWSLRRKVVVTSSIPWTNRHSRGSASFDIGYVDTGAEWTSAERRSRPTVVAVHGSPATHTDVIPVVRPFHDRGCRVIAVNLPGYEHSTGVTKRDHELFCQSTTEIAEFLLDFLGSVDVRDVTMLVGHSGGALPATVLAVLSDMVRSVMFICPPPGHRRTPSMEPILAVRLLAKFYNYTVGRMILRPLLPVMNKMIVGLQSDRPSHIMSALRYASNIDYALLRETARRLELKKLPMLYVCSENDALISFRLSMQWAERLGVTRALCDEYDSQFVIRKEAGDDCRADGGYKKGVIFARGGHFPQLKADTTLPILLSEAQTLLNIALSDQNAEETSSNLLKS